MPSGSDSPERARADLLANKYAKNREERERANARLEVRAEMRSSNELEDTGVINLRAEDAMKLKQAAEQSEPPAKLSAWTVVYLAAKRSPPWGIVIVLCALIAAYTMLKLKGAIR